jgi:hypothetical protein
LPLIRLVERFDRSVYWIPDSAPASFYLGDREGGGILINAPAFGASLLTELQAVAPLKFLFLPSRLGAGAAAAWRDATACRTLAHAREAPALAVPVDVALEREHRFSRTIDFLPMSGRTAGSCALRCRNLPGMVFFGPILEHGADGWPCLIPHPDDHSWENRLIGALGLKHLAFDYAFCDNFDPATGKCGPGASAAIATALERALA